MLICKNSFKHGALNGGLKSIIKREVFKILTVMEDLDLLSRDLNSKYIDEIYDRKQFIDNFISRLFRLKIIKHQYVRGSW